MGGKIWKIEQGSGKIRTVGKYGILCDTIFYVACVYPPQPIA